MFPVHDDYVHCGEFRFRSWTHRPPHVKYRGPCWLSHCILVVAFKIVFYKIYVNIFEPWFKIKGSFGQPVACKFGIYSQCPGWEPATLKSLKPQKQSAIYRCSMKVMGFLLANSGRFKNSDWMAALRGFVHGFYIASHLIQLKVSRWLKINLYRQCNW